MLSREGDVGAWVLLCGAWVLLCWPRPAKLLIFIGIKKKEVLGQNLSFRLICYNLSCHPTGTNGISLMPG